MIKISSLVFIVLIFASGCKKWQDIWQEETDYSEEMPVISAKEGLANSVDELSRTGDFYYNVWDGEFVLNINKLPDWGEVEHLPYSGYWYPQSTQGTNLVITPGGQSPLAKYDQAFNTGGASVNWELQNHTSTLSWAGHCNGFSSAAQRHAEPFKSVVRGGVTFDPIEIKALLAEVYMGSKYFFLGGNRCEQTGTISGNIWNRPNKQYLGECEDINAGTFHVALANWVGIKKHTIIFDSSTNNEVWNFPLYYYNADLAIISKDQALAALGQYGTTQYAFNAAAVKFLRVSNAVTYAQAINPERLTGSTPSPITHVYDYILEVNAEDEVIGGEWLGDSVTNHPDFLWVALEPMQGAGTNFNGNPYLNPAEVIKMWAESIGADPENPPLDIFEPVDTRLSSWGKFPKFEVSIDGNSRGASFLGKPLKLSVKRLGGFTGTLDLNVTVNGVGTATATTTKDYDTLLIDISAKMGINSLYLSWNRAGSKIDEASLFFHSLP